jgi:hypothetical protein
MLPHYTSAKPANRRGVHFTMGESHAPAYEDDAVDQLRAKIFGRSAVALVKYALA